MYYGLNDMVWVWRCFISILSWTLFSLKILKPGFPTLLIGKCWQQLHLEGFLFFKSLVYCVLLRHVYSCSQCSSFMKHALCLTFKLILSPNLIASCLSEWEGKRWSNAVLDICSFNVTHRNLCFKCVSLCYMQIAQRCPMSLLRLDL